VISAQDSPGFCLAMAQIIPTLLVAVFVADRTLSLAPTAREVESAAEQERDRAEREKMYITMREQSEARRSRSIGALTSAIDKRQELAGERAGLIEDRNEVRNQLTEISPDSPTEEKQRGWLARADSAIEQTDMWIAQADTDIDTRKGLINEEEALLSEITRVEHKLAQQKLHPATDRSRPRIQGWYKYILGLLVLVGLIGEVFALLGGLHWAPNGYTVPIFVSTLAVILMLGLMAQSAWLRIGPELVIKDDTELGTSADIKGTLVIATITSVALVLLCLAVAGSP
jgi:hypothetical protein